MRTLGAVMMRKLLGTVSLSAAILAALFGSANAADMVVKAPLLPPAPAYNWTGFYIGAHAGGAFDNDQFNFQPAGTFTNNTASSFLGGGQVGYNYQISNWVVGLEGDGDWTHLFGFAPCPNPFFTCGHNIEWLASVRARVGYVAADRFLFYVTGGAGFS